MAAAQPVNIKAAASTILVHVLLFLIFIFVSYSTPASAPVEELGMEVNLGTNDDGSGDEQPMSVDAPAATATAVNNTYHATAQHTESSKELMQSDDPDAPAVAPTVTPEQTTRHNTQTTVSNRRTSPQYQPQTEATAHPKAQQPRYVYNGGTGTGGNNAVANKAGTSEGNTTGNGDRGVPGGTPGAANYTGSPGNGTGGISHTLGGRDISPRQFVAEFNEGGKVVVRVKVDRDGNIISKSVTKSPNPVLSRIALQKLSQAKFSRNPDAAPEQIGDVTFVFKTRSQ